MSLSMWTRALRRRAAAGVIAGALTATMAVAAAPAATGAELQADPFTALVFSKTAGFRHDSIPAGIAAIQSLGSQHGFQVTATEDANAFTDTNLARFDVVVWLSTTGDVLNDQQQGAFERYVRAGGGFAGVHSASDTEYNWSWYGSLVGAYFANHPANQNASVKVEDPAHPSTAHVGPRWQRFDEWYNYRTNPRGNVHVLASLDESSYNPGTGAMGVEHPVSWCHEYDGGRSWYTGMGHTVESFNDQNFRQHLLGGIQTAAGALAADCGASQPGSFAKVTLDDTTANPMKLDIAADGRVFYIDRTGAVRIIRPNGSKTTAGTLSVHTGQEFGLLGIALDPDFATNNWIYLYHSPAGTRPVDRVSRFTMNGDTLNLGSAVTVLEIGVQRSECCHAGGALAFDAQRNLYVATGDNTNPFASDGYSPIDERPGRAHWDSQGTAANSNVLNGKILRIHPESNGTYTIPQGNMFAPGTQRTRSEIYAMGFRNPFTIGVDPETGTLVVADYGPDANSSNPSRGPDGRVEWNTVNEPGFYGWPYCVGNNTPYIDYNFATAQSGSAFNCAGGPVNNSPNNTGITQLPRAISAELWMGKSSTGTPEVGGSGALTTSAVYRYRAASDRAWPEYWDGKAVMGDWNDGRLFAIQPDATVSGVSDVSRIFPAMQFTRVHDLKWGPDGALYVIDWGSGFGGNNADSGIYRIDYLRANAPRDPVATVTADKTSGPLPLTVRFSGAGSSDPAGQPLSYAWDFDGNGTTDATGQTVSHTYTQAGTFVAALTVTAQDGRSAVSDVEIVAGNTAPTITVRTPVNGSIFDWGDSIRYEVTVTDPEDGTIDCAQVVTQPAIGHDEHAHPYGQYFGCSGSFPLPGDAGHGGEHIFGVVTVTYTDKGGPGGAKPLSSQKVVVLQTRHTEAEYFHDTGRVSGGAGSDTEGVEIEATTDQGGGENVGWITDGDWFGYQPMNLTGITAVQIRASSESVGGTVEVRSNSPTGPLLGSAVVAPTGGWQNWTTVTAQLSGVPAGGGSSLYFVVRRPSGNTTTSYLMNVNWVEFVGTGSSDNMSPVLTAGASPRTGTTPLTVAFTASASDPDGDNPLAYRWDFGDGATATTANASRTYTQPGTYTARVTVTDARGAFATETFEITATEPSGGQSGELVSGSSGRCLDVEGVSTQPGANLHIWDCHSGTNQAWTHTASGELTVYSGGSQRCLDAEGTAAGAGVQIWNCQGGANQKWQVNSNGTITSTQSGLCLDVFGGGTANGTDVVLWTCNGGGNQRWSFR